MEKFTKFQSRLLSDKDAIWDIIKLFHPDIPNTVSSFKGDKIFNVRDKIEVYVKYQWVCISFRIREYGVIDIGITNSNNHTLYGGGITKDDMKDALDNGDVKFRAWRFSLDKIYRENEELARKTEKSLDYMAGRLLSLHGYKLVEVDEWFDYYYSD